MELAQRYIQQEMQMSKPVEVVLASDYDLLLERTKKLEQAVREFAGFFSSDDAKHWELHGLADDAEYDNALRSS